MSSTDTSPISILPQQAQSGLIVVADGVGRDCAGQCAQIIDMLHAVQDTIPNINNVTGFGGKPSGNALQSIYNNAANSLQGVLDDHIAVLTDLGETFIWAQQHYSKADGDAADDFKKLIDADRDDTSAYMGDGLYTGVGSSSGGSDNGPSYVSDVGQNNGQPNMKWPSARAFTDPVIGAASNYDSRDGDNNGMAFDYGDAARVEAANRAKPGASSGVKVENTSSMAPPDRWNWYADVNMGINKAIPTAVSTNWMAMAGRLSTALGNFTSSMQKTQNASPPQWTGDGMAAAIGAVNSYAGSLTQLTGDMKAIGESLQNASGWLDLVQKNTQMQPGGYDDSPDARTRLATADGAWNNWYAPEVESSAYSVPTFASPLSGPARGGAPGDGGQGGAPLQAPDSTAEDDAPPATGVAQQVHVADQPATLSTVVPGQPADSGHQPVPAGSQAVQDFSRSAQIGVQNAQQAVAQGVQNAQHAVEQGVLTAQQAVHQAAQALQDAPHALAEAVQNVERHAAGLPPIVEPRRE